VQHLKSTALGISSRKRCTTFWQKVQHILHLPCLVLHLIWLMLHHLQESAASVATLVIGEASWGAASF